jgi:hypothetical protein
MVRNDVAFIAPTHPKDFHYTADLIDSHSKYNISSPLYLVFSSDIDIKIFERDYPVQYDIVKSTCYAYPHVIRGQPTYYKKWWMVNEIIDEYEYFLLMDIEFQFVKHVDVYQIVKDEFSKKRFFGHITDVNTPRGVQQGATFCFNNEERERIARITNYWDLYLYWNTLPMVERETAKEFMTKYNILNQTHPCDPETYPYQYFLLLYHDWTITDLTKIPNSVYAFGILECGGTNKEMLDIMKPYFTYWLSYKLEPDKFKDCNIFMTIHHDRQNGWYGPPGPPVKFYTAPHP